jgi:hypothetical protein
MRNIDVMLGMVDSMNSRVNGGTMPEQYEVIIKIWLDGSQWGALVGTTLPPVSRALAIQ